MLIAPFYLHHEWSKSSCSAAFDVIEYPYIMSKDSNTVPSRFSKYPQCGNMYALIVTKPVKHTKKFVPNFSGTFKVLSH